MTSGSALLSADLTVSYAGKPPVLRGARIEVAEGEILGLVGQSGSGKSTIALALLGLLDHKRTRVEGSIRFQNQDLLQMKESELRRLRGRAISLVLQSPLTSLNPALRIHTQMLEAWRVHGEGTLEDGEAAIRSALAEASLPSDREFLRKFPSQASVGQAQRVLIAMAILHRPALLIADEATSALDVITQSEILTLFANLNRDLGTSMLYISHDLPSVAGICHRIAILHQGTVVECRPTAQVFSEPVHPYTKQLLAAQPRVPVAERFLSKPQAAAAKNSR